MPLIQPPPAPPKKETIAIRLDAQILEELRRYAACVPTKNLSHVIAGALQKLFDEDGDYKTLLNSHPELLAQAKPRRGRPTAAKQSTHHSNPPSSASPTASDRHGELRNSIGGA